ncbi:MAG: hypothetical protein ACOX9B_03990 [Candidatus Xenobium sp.]|jgi:hypothetical protein|nr:hypothetical protein [Burkholderiales bacterium]
MISRCNWKARWAGILTLTWLIWLTGNHVIWEAASSRPIFSLQWHDPNYLGPTASVKLALDESREASQGSVPAWPTWVVDETQTASLFKQDSWEWRFATLPDASSGKLQPQTQIYPPLIFLVGSAGLACFGPEPSAAQTASNLLLLAFVALMAYHGWQLAGLRGALLLGLATAASPWVTQWQRYFNYVPGVLMMLAAAMVSAHPSKNLTRPVACVWVGLTLGIGLLFGQQMIFMAAPWLVALVIPEIFKTRASLLMGFLTLLVVQTIHLLMDWHLRGDPTHLEGNGPVVTWATMALLAGLLATAWLCSRWKGWNTGTGLAMTTAIAGLLSAPYYMSRLDMQTELIKGHMVFVEQPIQELLASTWTLIRILHTFEWLGLVWLVVGLLALCAWPTFRGLGLKLAFTGAGIILSMAIMNPPILKYFSVILPMALTLGFLWAARWRTTFVGAMLFLLGMLWVQTGGWLYIDGSRVRGLPVPVAPLSLLLESPQLEAALWTYLPLADIQTGEPRILDQIPPGARISVLYGIDTRIPRDRVTYSTHNINEEFLNSLCLYLHLRGRVIAPNRLQEGDYILTFFDAAEGPMPFPRTDRLQMSGPTHLSIDDAPTSCHLRAQLRRANSSWHPRQSGGASAEG